MVEIDHREASQSMPDFTSLMDLAPILADLAAVGALVLSLLAYSNSRREKRPRLSVGVDVVDFEGTFDNRGYPDTPPMTIKFIDIANPSERRAKVVSVVIELAHFIGPIARHKVRDHYPDFQSNPEPPAVLVPGDNMGLSAEFDEFKYWASKKARADGNLKFRAIANDAIGNSYLGDWIGLA